MHCTIESKFITSNLTEEEENIVEKGLNYNLEKPLGYHRLDY